jgi:hypothetical protein
VSHTVLQGDGWGRVGGSKLDPAPSGDRMTEDTERSPEDLQQTLRQWRVAHPHATFAEMEVVVEEQLAGLRATLLEALVLPLAAQPGEPDAARPWCTHCGRALVWRGTHERRLTVAGEQQVRLRRAYASCPTCGVGVFPPG